MGITTAVVNQKGGVGKTTTSVNLAAYIATFGKKALLIDLDPQGNATVAFGVDRSPEQSCIYNVLTESVPIQDIIKKTNLPNLDIIPATSRLAGAEVELVNMPTREGRLKKAIFDIRDKYEHIIIDCPPSLNLLTVNALSAADEVIVPIQCEYYALEGISQLMQTLELVRERLNPALKIRGVILTMYDSRTILSNQVAEETKKTFGNKVFKSMIPRNVRLAEAPSFGQPIIFYDPNSNGAQAYENFAKEVIGDEST